MALQRNLLQHGRKHVGLLDSSNKGSMKPYELTWATGLLKLQVSGFQKAADSEELLNPTRTSSVEEADSEDSGERCIADVVK